MEEILRSGMIVSHFKRKDDEPKDSTQYLYKIISTDVTHTEDKTKLVVYEALYNSADGKIHVGDVFARPYDMFMSEVDRVKYPNVRQTYRFEPYYFD